MREASTETHPANDLLRASRLPLLPIDNPEVAKDLKKIRTGSPLSPVLLVRGDLAGTQLLQIADGYHRVCTSYHVNEDGGVPCRIAVIPAIAVDSSPGRSGG